MADRVNGSILAAVDSVEICPMCMSTFDSRKFKLVDCEVCSAEGSTACCVTAVEPHLCTECQ